MGRADDRQVGVDVAARVHHAGPVGRGDDRLGVGAVGRERLLDEQVHAAGEARLHDRQVCVGGRADEHGLGAGGAVERVDAGVERCRQALARQVRGEARIAIDETHQLGLGVDLEQVAVDHPHAAGADHRGAERSGGRHEDAPSIRTHRRRKGAAWEPAAVDRRSRADVWPPPWDGWRAGSRS
ncbi:MAG: hypothetical protein U0807_14945 [Candidatus Binatia bacterium]